MATHTSIITVKSEKPSQMMSTNDDVLKNSPIQAYP